MMQLKLKFTVNDINLFCFSSKYRIIHNYKNNNNNHNNRVNHNNK